jgi:hypothetical protein
MISTRYTTLMFTNIALARLTTKIINFFLNLHFRDGIV